MHLYDILNELELDPDREFKTLNQLLLKKDLYTRIFNGSCHLYAVIESFILQLEMRCNHISCQDLLKTLKLVQGEIVLEPTIHTSERKYSLRQLILFSEFILTIACQGAHLLEKIDYDAHCLSRFEQIITNIHNIINKLNYTQFEKQNFIFICPKNKEVEEVINCVEDKEIAIELLHYNHHSLKGDLYEKQKILSHLGKHIEPLIRNKKLSNNGYKKVEDDIGFYLNNFHIRHNNREGTHSKDFISQMDDEALENWYDIVYNTIVSIIVLDKQIDYHNKLDSIKQQIKN